MGVRVPVAAVAALCNPLEAWPWPGDRPSPPELATLLVGAAPQRLPVGGDDAALHAGRIRFLALNGWSDAIELDVGIPCLGYPGPNWPCTDGNHRLAAAIWRGDAEILVDVAGQVDHAAEILGVAEELLLGARAPSKGTP